MRRPSHLRTLVALPLLGWAVGLAVAYVAAVEAAERIAGVHHIPTEET